jgi:hypothetical protein
MYVMAQKILVEMLDDLDGGEADQTVPFALDGVSYEIDLSDANAAALRDELGRYVDAGRRIGGRKVRVALGQSAAGGSPSVSSASSADRERNQKLRAWAVDNGYEISARGRIRSDIAAAFEAAEAAPAVEPEPAKPVRKRRKAAAK